MSEALCEVDLSKCYGGVKKKPIYLIHPLEMAEVQVVWNKSL